MANSGTVTAGSAALASQYNNLRDDVLNVSTGHTHTGASEDGALVAATGVSSGTAALGAVLTADGSGAAAFLVAGASGGILKYEEFTSSGSFVIPANASSSAIVVVEIGDGGEGGRGGNKDVGVCCVGGAGGAMVTYYNLLSTLGTAGGTATVTIGAGGAGGAGATVSATRGDYGAVGGYSSIGILESKARWAAGTPTVNNAGRYSPQVIVSGVFHTEYTAGMQDNGGTVAGGTVYQTRTHTNGGNAFMHPSDNTAGQMGQDSDFNGAAGGGGGNSGTADRSGGNGGKRWGYRGGHFVGFDTSNRSLITVGNGVAGGAGAAGGGSAGSAAVAGSGGGGGGGGGASTGNGGVGGAGAAPGGGGGGGGGSSTGNGGNGGAGGAGRVRVWVIG